MQTSSTRKFTPQLLIFPLLLSNDIRYTIKYKHQIMCELTSRTTIQQRKCLNPKFPTYRLCTCQSIYSKGLNHRLKLMVNAPGYFIYSNRTYNTFIGYKPKHKQTKSQKGKEHLICKFVVIFDNLIFPFLTSIINPFSNLHLMN